MTFSFDSETAPAETVPIQELRTAFYDWNRNVAYLDNAGNYRLKPEGFRAGGIACWNKAAKRAYPDNAVFCKAAQRYAEWKATDMLDLTRKPKFSLGQRVRFPGRDAAKVGGVGAIDAITIMARGCSYRLADKVYDDHHTHIYDPLVSWYAESELSPMPETPTQEPSNS